MTETRPKILFLPKWYPDRFDPMPGIFVKLLAEAVSVFCDVAVLYVHEDAHCPNRFELEIAEENNLKVIRVYFRSGKSNVPLLSGIVRIFRFFKAYWLGLRILSSFPEDLVHVHVLTRAGFIAYLIRKKWDKPYLISEHWSRYFKENNTYKGFLRKLITRLVVKHAKAVVSVSDQLKQALLEQKLENSNHLIVPNPVSPLFFENTVSMGSRSKKRIIHVSCFDDLSKNITGFLEIVKAVSQKRSDFEVLLVGDGPDFQKCRKVALELQLLDSHVVSFCGLKENQELAVIMTDADFLVLSSNYETFGSVVIESLACGTPVVATSVGVVPAVINESNGLVVPPGDPARLEQAILEMLDKSTSYDRKEIREKVRERYSLDTIGREMFDIYKKILGL
jgi:glycosyltransferase involved in cell wall biosynthesis